LTLRIGPSDETRELAESFRAPETERVPTQLKRVDRALFVGREAELARLRPLRATASETTHVGLIVGEAGSGKTGLAARFAVETAAEGTTVLYGACGEQALVRSSRSPMPSGRAVSRASTRRSSRSAWPAYRGTACCSCSTTSSGPTGSRWRCSAGSSGGRFRPA
jgi:AAA ATPase domain